MCRFFRIFATKFKVKNMKSIRLLGIALLLAVSACGRVQETPQVEGHYTYEHAFDYDMAGNQWEWTADNYGAYPAGTEEEPAVDPQGAVSGDPVKRGGSFWRGVENTASANRTGATNTYADYGFRVLCRPE